MKTYTKWLAAALFAASVHLAPAAAAAGVVQVAPAVPETGVPVITVQSSCNVVGQQQAAQYGGTLQSVQAVNRGGQTVCVGVVIVQGKDGERGRRISFEVPL